MHFHLPQNVANKIHPPAFRESARNFFNSCSSSSAEGGKQSGGEGKAVVAQLRRRVCAKWLLACILHSWLGGSHVVVCVACECVVGQVCIYVCARVCAWHR